MRLLKALEIHFAIGVNGIVITIIPIKLLMREKKQKFF